MSWSVVSKLCYLEQCRDWFRADHTICLFVYYSLFETPNQLVEFVPVDNHSVTAWCPPKHETFSQWWFNVGQSSQTMDQHQNNTGSTSLACRIVAPRSLINVPLWTAWNQRGRCDQLWPAVHWHLLQRLQMYCAEIESLFERKLHIFCCSTRAR